LQQRVRKIGAQGNVRSVGAFGTVWFALLKIYLIYW